MTRNLADARQALSAVFERFEAIEQENTAKVLSAFSELKVAQRHFAATEGYGYDDIGRDTLEKLFAAVFHTDSALVRPQLTSGTHTLALCLFGLLRPGDHLLSVTGAPYDTMQTVIGLSDDGTPGTLREMGVSFDAVPLKNGQIDLQAALMVLRPETRLVLMQRSRGYSGRPALSPEAMGAAARALKAARPDLLVMADNCYGEFTQTREPPDCGVDLAAGSLIKNPGGGLAPTGGYIVGPRKALDRVAARLTAPGIGGETGSYAAGYRLFYQGLFMAPHTVCQALKTAALAAFLAARAGYDAAPGAFDERNDIIEALSFHDKSKLLSFCRAVQAASPVDAFVTPEPWAMPGYQDEVIMAAGTFVGGASIELSCDGPLRPPYTAYLQGALTFSHGALALERAFATMDAPC